MRSTLAFVALLASATPAWCGTFGVGSFESDYALDWAVAVTKQPDTTIVFDTLRRARREPYIGESLQAKTVAAAEVVAALIGHPGDNIPPDLEIWVKRQSKRPSESEVALARAALERVLDPKHSEIATFWKDDVTYGWRASVNELMHRLLTGNRQPAESVPLSGDL